MINHYLNQWWLIYWHIYASLGLDDLNSWAWCISKHFIISWVHAYCKTVVYPLLTHYASYDIEILLLNWIVQYNYWRECQHSVCSQFYTDVYQSSYTHFVDIHQPYTNHTPTVHMKSRVYPKKRSFNYNSKFNEKYTLLLFHFSLTYNYNFWHPPQQLDGLVQERRNSTANAMELHLSCTNPSSCTVKKLQQSLNQNLDKGKRQFPLNLNCNWNLINEMDSGTARVTLNLFFPYPKFFPIKSFSDKVIPIFVEIG